MHTFDQKESEEGHKAIRLHGFRAVLMAGPAKQAAPQGFCDLVRIALTIEQCNDGADALILLEQDFRPRNVKGMLAGIARLQETGAIRNTRLAAEPVAVGDPLPDMPVFLTR